MKRLLAVTTMALGLLSAFPLFSHGSEALELPNPGFEEANADQTWPEGWPTLKQGGQYGTDEDGNRFLRMTASEPGKMTMLYREIAIPEGVDALELKFRYRLHDFKRGSQSWFDARIMMEFMDAARNKVSPNPPAPNFTRNQGEWKEVDCRYSTLNEELVPVQIREYVKTNFPDTQFVQIEKGYRGYEVKLTNRLELTFDNQFRLVDIDD